MDDWPDFRKVDWSNLYPRLLLYAEGRLRRLQWPRGRPQSHDFVQHAIEKALSKARTFDNGKTLFHNLCQIISSDISHDIGCFDNRHIKSEDDTIINIIDYQDSPEYTTHYRHLVGHFLNYLGSHDAEAKIIANLIINSDITRSSELAVQSGFSVREIENIKKRLRRLIEKYQTNGVDDPVKNAREISA